MRRGEIWWATLPGSWGRRPVLLLAPNAMYPRLSGVMVAPITTQVRPLPTWINLDPHVDGVPARCAVNLDAMHVMEPSRFERFITLLREERLEEVDLAIHRALGIRYCPER